MNEHIYALKIDGRVIYIGKTVDLKRRYGEHLRDKSGSPKSIAIQNALKEGKDVLIEVIATVPRGKLGGMEDEEIQKVYDNGGKLTNQIGGNKGVQLTAAEAHQLNKAIQYHKACNKPKKGVVDPRWTLERRQQGNELYEQYKRGEVTLEQLKQYSESVNNENND